MRRRRSDAKAYLERHLTGHSGHSDIAGLALARASQWTNATIESCECDDATIVEASFGKNRITYAYIPVSDIDISSRDDEIAEYPWRYQELTLAEIHDLENNNRLDLVDKLPEGWKIFIDFSDYSVYADTNQRVVVLPPYFGSAATYFALAHEIGHAQDYAKNPGLFSEPRFTDSKTTLYARILEVEQNASNFAYHELSPFLSEGQDGILSVEGCALHGQLNLRTYIDRIREEQDAASRKKSAVTKLGVAALVGGALAARKLIKPTR